MTVNKMNIVLALFMLNGNVAETHTNARLKEEEKYDDDEGEKGRGGEAGGRGAGEHHHHHHYYYSIHSFLEKD
jgi:hypothetical protein